MNDIEPLPLKTQVMQEIENCNDIELLDFIYKLIVYDTQKDKITFSQFS